MLNIPDKPIYIVNNEENTEKFIQHCMDIYHENKEYKNSFCGIDIEYNTYKNSTKRYIGIIQIIFISNSNEYFTDKEKPIFVFSPNDLSQTQRDMFVKYILCSKITKIWHGSDSLDYPILYNSLLQDNDNFMKFINSSVDTRFLCELSKRLMSRLNLIKKDVNKCSIYNALLDHNVINKKKFNELCNYASKVNYNKDWIITKLKDHQIIYSVYDVVYLYDLLYNISQRIKSNHKIIEPISLINRLYRFHMINRLNIIDISNECKNIDVSKKQLVKIDEQIKEKELCDITYKHNKKTHTIKLYLEDVLYLDTIRKNILSCLRVYQIDIGKNNKIDMLLRESKYFNMLKGKTVILYLIDLIRHFNEYTYAKCEN